MKQFAILLIALVHQCLLAAEVNAVVPIEDCFLCSKEPSMTMHWKGSNSKAVLIVIPGGTGVVGISQDRKDLKQSYFENLKRLADPDLSNGLFDLVVIDSPRILTTQGNGLSGRGEKEHMIRIESVLKYYKEKTGLPVWMLGQSNGGVSLANFFRYLTEKKQMELIAGAIASTTRPETNFPTTLSTPILFITHKLDGCRNLDQLKTIFESVKKSNTALTDWTLIEGGEAEGNKDPCRSGYHMFYKSGADYARTIEKFIFSNP